MRLTIALTGLVCVAGAIFVIEPAGSAQNSRGSHACAFVTFATVVEGGGFALFGSRMRVRRSEEWKFRWEATSDHSGSPAFRVPPGADYEMTIEAVDLKTRTRQIDAHQEKRTDLTIRMEPHAEPSAGGKP